jgi:hypothetical protein
MAARASSSAREQPGNGKHSGVRRGATLSPRRTLVCRVLVSRLSRPRLRTRAPVRTREPVRHEPAHGLRTYESFQSNCFCSNCPKWQRWFDSSRFLAPRAISGASKLPHGESRKPFRFSAAPFVEADEGARLSGTRPHLPIWEGAKPRVCNDFRARDKLADNLAGECSRVSLPWYSALSLGGGLRWGRTVCVPQWEAVWSDAHNPGMPCLGGPGCSSCGWE